MDDPKRTETRCTQCGMCCRLLSPLFWIHGDFNGLIDMQLAKQAIIALDVTYDKPEPCEYLEYKDGKAVCGIVTDYGEAFMPPVCRQYRERADTCIRDIIQAMKEAALRYMGEKTARPDLRLPEPQKQLPEADS